MSISHLVPFASEEIELVIKHKKARIMLELLKHRGVQYKEPEDGFTEDEAATILRLINRELRMRENP